MTGRRFAASARRGGRAVDDGTAIGMAGIGLAMAGMLAVVAIDAGAYLLSASRAQSLADSAALAAAVAIEQHRSATSAAERVVAAGDAELMECDCTSLPVRVRVGVDVVGLVIPQLTARQVVATANATMVDR